MTNTKVIAIPDGKVKDGYIIDYISGNEVKGTPEEIQAVQPFSKIL